MSFETVTLCKALHYFYEKTIAIYNWRYKCNTPSDMGISVAVGSSIIIIGYIYM